MTEEIREEQVEQEETAVEETEQETTEQNQESTETEEIAEDETTEEKPAKQDHVPLNKYMAEKKRRQELERKFAAQEADREKLRITTDYVNRGYPEDEALRLAEKDVNQRSKLEALEAKQLDYDIKDLAKDPFFADAETYRDDIKEKIRDLKCDAETAYMLIRGKTRTREFQTVQEQKNLNQRRKVEQKKVVSASPSAPKNPYPLDDHDKKALAGLQKAQPGANWTAEKYYKTLKT